MADGEDASLQEQPDDLRATLENALAEQRANAPAPVDDDKPVEPVADKAPAAPRAADGKFAAKVGDAPDIDPVAAGDAPKPDVVPSIAAPPASWSPQAKALWGKDALSPAEVAVWKAEAVKREGDVEKGFREYGEYKPLKPYMDMARQSGTTLDKALENYTGLEKLLRKDVFAGVERMLQNMRVDPVAFANAYLARQGVSQQSGNQPQPAPQAQFNSDDLINRAKSAAMQEFRQEQQTARVHDQINSFASDPKNIYFKNVEGAMSSLITSGLAKTLEDAYDKACKLDPVISTLIQQRPSPVPGVTTASSAVPQARAAAKATMGAPSAGLKPGSSPEQSLSIREAAVAALAAQRGRA